jgi:hypothetical protein
MPVPKLVQGKCFASGHCGVSNVFDFVNIPPQLRPTILNPIRRFPYSCQYSKNGFS